MQKPKVAFFDLNHTCLNMAGATKDEILGYKLQIEDSSWSPLILPTHWRDFNVYADVAPAIYALRMYKQIRCVTLSNNPIDFQIDQLRRTHFDFMVPLEAYHVFKPDVKAYQVACNLLQVAPEDALMVTANRTFGDLEGANTIGMPSVWIDRKNEDNTYPIKNLMDLVKYLK
jgi:FMN phosphatase YigB (HAD superfamily)